MGGRMKYGPRFAQSGAGGKVGYDPLMATLGGHFAQTRAKTGTVEAAVFQARQSRDSRERASITAEQRDKAAMDTVFGSLRALTLLVSRYPTAPAFQPLIPRAALMDVIERLRAMLNRAEAT